VGSAVENFFYILLIAISLALDAFAVSVSSGIAVPGFSWRHGVKMGIWFGFFQFAMPLAGYCLGTGVSACIEAVDHWIAFGLLAFIGGRMVYGSLVPSAQEGETSTDLSAKRLCLLAIATSIDALAVGVSMAFMPGVEILPAAVLIGGVAFVLSVMGGLLGKRLGGLFQQRAELAGGIVLIAIGIKILIEHLTA